MKKISYISLYLSILCVLAVLAFHFPEFLTNPKLRAAYDPDQLRLLLFYSMYIALGMAVISMFWVEQKIISLWAIILVTTSIFLGGSSIPVNTPVRQFPVYLSLDLIILDLFFMSLIFIPLEKFFPLHKKNFFREGLKTDLSHYGLNHLLMGGIFFLISLPGNWLKERFIPQTVPEFTQSLPLWLQVLLILFVADFAQYWIHRIFHKRERLWQFHKIHHSPQTMDWLASSRLHVVDVILTRSFSYIPIVCLGFSEKAVQVYLPIVALLALFVHSNVHFKLNFLKYIFTTPQVHHWHHSAESASVDKNFAVTFSFIDVIFGTYYCPSKWPEKYGLYNETISENFLKQLAYPFLKAGKSIIKTIRSS